jgi:hypothetical protein
MTTSKPNLLYVIPHMIFHIFFLATVFVLERWHQLGLQSSARAPIDILG